MGFSLNNTSDARSFKHIRAPRNFALLKSCTTPAHHHPLSLTVTSKFLLCFPTSFTPSPVNTVHDCPCHLNLKIKMELKTKQNTSNYAATKCASQVREWESQRPHCCCHWWLRIMPLFGKLLIMLKITSLCHYLKSKDWST